MRSQTAINASAPISFTGNTVNNEGRAPIRLEANPEFVIRDCFCRTRGDAARYFLWRLRVWWLPALLNCVSPARRSAAPDLVEDLLDKHGEPAAVQEPQEVDGVACRPRQVQAEGRE